MRLIQLIPTCGLSQSQLFYIVVQYILLEGWLEGGKTEFDIVTLDDKGYIFYEAKFRKEPISEGMVQNEICQVKQTGLKCYRYGFFSRAGFACEAGEDRVLIELWELYS